MSTKKKAVKKNKKAMDILVICKQQALLREKILFLATQAFYRQVYSQLVI